MSNISNEVIAQFLEGRNPMKYVVAIETSYGSNIASVIVNDPNLGKSIKVMPFKAFAWVTAELGNEMYKRNKSEFDNIKKKFGITFKKLKTTNEQGYEPARMKLGYKYLLQCNGSYNDISSFIKAMGIDVRSDEWRQHFLTPSPTEQFMIQTGIRLFKGFEEYDELHRMQFDIETTGLDPKCNRITQIGIRDNRGFQHILSVTGNTPAELRQSERDAIKILGFIIKDLAPDIFSGYNSEDFDFTFIFERANLLGVDINETYKGINGKSVERKSARLKLGQDTFNYKQTYLWGINILDISHAVRKTMAINSEIKGWGLKYITKYSEIEKKNRVYVAGDIISKTWLDTEPNYLFNDDNGDWFEFEPENPDHQDCLYNGYVRQSGRYIVERYLIDDLWETDKIDEKFNQAAFLLSKLIPTSYMRSSTMGTAGIWQLIMMAWSYENDLAVPQGQPQQSFTGGLSRLLEVGYAKRVIKLDYAALYPNTEITHDIFPEHDISGVMKGLLIYIAETRDIYKGMKGDYEKKAEAIKKKIAEGGLSTTEITKLEEEYKEFSRLATLYDMKQLPIKILANSFFGSFGAPHIFRWGDIDCAEETTCRGRQYLRLMVTHFTYKYGCRPLVCDSVTYDTPVYLKNKHTGHISIKPICEVYNPKDDVFQVGKQDRDLSEKEFYVLTVNGWKDVSYVYRHPTEKQIHQLVTKDRLVRVTEDHSVFQNQIQIKPKSLKRGDKIDVYNEFNYEIYTKNPLDEYGKYGEDYYWMLGYFLVDGSSLIQKKKLKYKQKKTGKDVTYETNSCEFKISGSDLNKLNKLLSILQKYHPECKFSIKNHMTSSSVYNLVCYNKTFSKWFNDNFYTSYREKTIPSFILNETLENKRSFMNGVLASDGYGDELGKAHAIGMKSQMAMAGVAFLLKTLAVEYKIHVHPTKPNFIKFLLNNANRNGSSFTEKTLKETDKVWRNDLFKNNDPEGFVYDISTGDGTFIGGIGLINLKNTDGMNFAIPDEIDQVEYLCQGLHRFTEKYKGQVLKGIDAVVAEFNDLYMIGRMGLDVDDICESTINFSRKNYANHIVKKGKPKIKLVGNTIKSNKMPKYIEEFLDKGIRFLLNNKGYEFIELYYQTVDKIVNYQIPLSKIASKAKVRTTYAGYEEKCKSLNKAGNPMPRQAHMELAIQNNLIINIGDTIYYINTGKSAKDGDIKTIKNKETGKIEEVVLNCKLLPIEDVENNPDATTDEYNAYKYLEMFNNRIKRLLVCFKPEIRDKIIISYVDNKEIYEIVNGRKKFIKELEERSYFTEAECELCAGIPLSPNDQDDVELDLMLMEDREVEFWKRVNKVPNNMTDVFWEQFLVDYEERKRLTKIYNDFKSREMLVNDLFNLTPIDFDNFLKLEYPEWLTKKYSIEPIIDEQGNYSDIVIYSKSGTKLTSFGNVFKYKDIAIEIQEWKDKYKTKQTTAKWFNKFGEQVNINEYHLALYGRSYDDDLANITYIPREYKDYDALYAEAEAEFSDIT